MRSFFCFFSLIQIQAYRERRKKMKIFIANFSIIFVSLLVIDAKQIANVPNDLKSNHQHQHQQQQQHKDSKQTEKSKDGKIDTAKYFLWKDCG